MNQTILSSTIIEFMRSVIDGFMEENCLTSHLSKRKLGPCNTEGPQEIWNFPSSWLQDTDKNLKPHKKKIFVGGVGDPNADNQRVVMVGDQKWEIKGIAVRVIFFVWDSYSLFFYTGSFQVSPEKSHFHLKCQFPLKIPIWHKSLLYKPSEKWLNPPAPITIQGRGGKLCLVPKW